MQGSRRRVRPADLRGDAGGRRPDRHPQRRHAHVHGEHARPGARTVLRERPLHGRPGCGRFAAPALGTVVGSAAGCAATPPTGRRPAAARRARCPAHAATACRLPATRRRRPATDRGLRATRRPAAVPDSRRSRIERPARTRTRHGHRAHGGGVHPAALRGRRRLCPHRDGGSARRRPGARGRGSRRRRPRRFQAPQAVGRRVRGKRGRTPRRAPSRNQVG